MKKSITIKQALFLLVVLLAMIGLCIIGFKLPAHVAILLAIAIVILFAVVKGFSWDDIHGGIQDGIAPGLVPIIIFILIGALISVWIAAGTIPTIMVYGFNLLSADYFLPAVFVICGVVGAAVGSSFTTISTVGIAFLGMGSMMGFNPAITTGAIVSGAFFGNSISPLSDTANLASAIAEVELFDHIRNELWTVLPTFLISLVTFGFLGLQHTSGSGEGDIQLITQTLTDHYTISVIALLPVILLFLAAWRKIPAIPTLLMSIALSLVIRYIYYPTTAISQVGKWIQDGYVATTGVADVDTLLTRGGMQSMMWSVSLILLALSLGGLLVKLNIIGTILSELDGFMNNKGRLILMTALSAIGVNLLIGEQYLSIILPGKAFKSSYDKVGIDDTILARTLQDAGATVNPLIPWGVSGVFITGTLGISTLSYMPFAFFCYLTPILTILLGFKKAKTKTAHKEATE
ncbi:Na+/H+ antiporter NhaC [Carnobacterium gallinarum]|uniref:Na+/H+ antiporter NhaC n=1 Tax=Carnobacterium gallinarum TaxID=2749 RepID=UPI0005501C58|nr:Na+/H+ antiporter NhaC [Carnobacterium gallinarum]